MATLLKEAVKQLPPKTPLLTVTNYYNIVSRCSHVACMHFIRFCVKFYVKFYVMVQVHCLYASMPPDQQLAVFAPRLPGTRKVIASKFHSRFF